MPGDDHVDAVLVGLVAQLLAHVHADDRADAGGGELLDDRLRALGAAGHVDPYLAGTGAGAALAEVRAGSLLRGDAVLGDLEQHLLHVFDESRLLLREILVEVVDHEVVGRGVRREEGHAEQTGRVDGLIVVERHETSAHLVHTLHDELLAGLDRHAQPGPDVGLHLHHAVELGETPAFGMVRVDRVDRHALLTQAVGEEHLAGVHVDAADERGDLRVGVAHVDARVVEGVGELFGVGKRFEVLGESVVALPRAGEELVDAGLAARVGLDAHTHGCLVDLA